MNFDYINDEYGWIESRFGKQGVDWTRQLQSLVEKDGKYLDKIQIRTLRDGRTHDLVFDVTRSYMQNVNDLHAKIEGQVGTSGQLSAANFPALEANESAKLLQQDCAVTFDKGIKDTDSGKYDENSLSEVMGALPAHQLELYKVCYRTGRYSETSIAAARRDAFAGEAGRAVAYGFDDALAGRQRNSVYIPSDSTLWNETDLAVFGNMYFASYQEAQDIGVKKTNWPLIAGIAGVFLAGVGGVYLWQKRQESNQMQGSGTLAMANPSYNYAKRADRKQARQDLQDELQAINYGKWPRDINDSMKWAGNRIADENLPAYAKKMVLAELKYLDNLEYRIAMKQVVGYEENPSRSPGMTVQSLLFSRDQWDVKSAKGWAKDHGYRYGDVDEKPNTIRMRQHDPSEFRKHTMRTIPFGEGYGIQAVVAKPKR